MLTFAQKSSIRRHLDYPVAGLLSVSPAGGSLASAFAGYRFFQAYGRLEWKMNNLNPDEEARLVGRAYGAVALVGPQPQPGDTISVTLSGGNIASAQTLTATAGSVPTGTDARPPLLAALAGAASLNAVLTAAGIVAVTPFGTGPFNENQLPLPEVAFSSPVAFTLSGLTGTGGLGPQLTADGTMLQPSAAVDGTTTVYGYLAILDALESAYAGASQNLDTSAAGPWKARHSEIAQRLALYRNWQIHLSRFLDIPLWPADSGRQQGYTGSMRYA